MASIPTSPRPAVARRAGIMPPRFHIIKAAASGSHPRAAKAVVEEAGGCFTPADIQRIHRIFDPRPDCGELLRQSIANRERMEAEIDADLRLIGWGLLIGCVAGCIVRLSQMGVLS